MFAAVEHEYASGGRVCMSEQQTIVYRGISPSAPAERAPDMPEPGTLRWRITPDPMLLFRYSALTFNAHRTL